MHAVESQTSGTVPLWRRDTAPAVTSKVELPVPTVTPFRREDGAAIEEPHVPSDITKGTIPLPFMITLISLALAGAGAVWRIENRVSVITTTIEYERELDRLRERELDRRFAELTAKIEAAGLRNAALALTRELEQRKEKP